MSGPKEGQEGPPGPGCDFRCAANMPIAAIYRNMHGDRWIITPHLHHAYASVRSLVVAPTSIKHCFTQSFQLASRLYYYPHQLLLPNNYMLYSTSTAYKDPAHSHPLASQSQQSYPASQEPKENLLMDLDQDTISLSSARNKELHIYWKKSIKSFILGLLKRCPHRLARPLIDQLPRVEFLLRKPCVARETNVIKSSNCNSKLKLASMCTLAPTKKVTQPACLVLSHCSHLGLKNESFFELTAINQQGKTLYNAIFLKNWQEIQRELVAIENYLSVTATVVQDKRQLMSILLPRDFELRRYIDSLEDLQDITALHQNFNKIPAKPAYSPDQSLGSQDLRGDLEFFTVGLRLFQFITKQLQQNLTNAERQYSSLKLRHFFSLAYNLTWPLVETTTLSLQEQVQDSFPFLKELLQRTEKRQSKLVGCLEPEHYPTSLENAHHCRNCKHKRGYIACECCSMSQGKTVSLCLDCYVPFHNASIKGPHIDSSQLLLQKWHSFDLLAQFAVQAGNKVPADPSQIQMKEQDLA